jgi:hypothetical protein
MPLPDDFQRCEIIGERTWGNAVECRVLNQPSFALRYHYPFGTHTNPHIMGQKGNKKYDKTLAKQNYDLDFI